MPTARPTRRALLTLPPALALTRLLSAQSPIKTFDPLTYGAKGDGKTLDTQPIQAAIDAAAAAGNNAQILLRPNRKFLTGTLELKSNTNLHLSENSELIASDNPAHYRDAALILATNAQNLKITGTGNIHGRARDFMASYDQEGEWWLPKSFRPKMFVLTACQGLEVHNISFSEAPEWGLHMLGCEHVLIDGLRVRNLLDVPNCDGIDPDHCRDVEIRNCDIVCGDDAIVIKSTRQPKSYGETANIRVHDCKIQTQDAGVKIGTETTEDIHHLTFERLEIVSSSRGIGIQLRDEGNVSNIAFRDINLVSRYHSDPWWGRGEAISLTALPRTPETKLGKLHTIEFRNIAARSENSARICGHPQSAIAGVTFDNVNLTLDRWTRYPGNVWDNRPSRARDAVEQHATPAFGLRHANGVTMNRCSVKWGANAPGTFTHALEAENVTALKLSDFTGKAAHPGRYADLSVGL